MTSERCRNKGTTPFTASVVIMKFFYYTIIKNLTFKQSRPNNALRLVTPSLVVCLYKSINEIRDALR